MKEKFELPEAPKELEKTDFEKLFDYDVKLPTNYDLYVQELEKNKQKTHDDIMREKDQLAFTVNFKF